MAVADQETVACGACGKRFSVPSAATDRQIRCSCGQITRLPARRPVPTPGAAAGQSPDDLYDLADEPAEPMPRHADGPVSPEEVLARLGHAHIQKKHVEPDAQALAAQREIDQMLAPAPLREVVIPIVLIAIGLVLSDYEVMRATNRPPASMIEGVVIVLMRAALSMGLVVGGVFLATAVFEVCIMGSFKRSILRICAIAIAPAALYGICSYGIGDVAGSATGTLVSVLAYALLFYLLMKLDAKDTSICVLVTWILVTFANYMAFKLQGARSGSWL